MRIYTKKDFIEKANKVHENKYDYSKVEYKNNRIKVCIICPEHGEFLQIPNNHLRGKGCPVCGKERRDLLNTSNTNEFINKARKIHGDKYDYSKVEYINSQTKVCIICSEHGEFWQRPNNHLNGQGCIKCSGKELLKVDNFINKSRAIHGNKYDYSKVKYINAKTKVCIICPKHGEFWQKPFSHLQGQGCPVCGKERRDLLNTSNTNEFINKAKEIHKDKYDYSKVEYVNNKIKVCIICPEHGEFFQSPDNHLRGQGCPKCGQMNSEPEDEIIELLEGLKPQKRNHEILGGKEIDIYIPSLKLGIEYNGLRWHSEKFGRDRCYHIDKLNMCNKNGIKLIQIFEDEWINQRKICESKLKQICGLNHNPKIYARKCIINKICKNDAEDFLNKNHIQGFVGAAVYLGAFCEDKLIGVMTFKREKEGYWDLNRFATDINYQCIGVGGKLFKYFTKNYEIIEIKSFADRRWTIDPYNNFYTKIGFELIKFMRPEYRYFKENRCERFHKFGFRKQILHKKYGLPLTMTEDEMTKELGYTRIWDCGLIKYVYKESQLPLRERIGLHIA